MQSVVVAVKRRLRHVLRLGHVSQAAAGSVHTYGAQVLPGHRFFFSSFSLSCFFSGFFLVLWLAVPWTSEQRTPPCTTATFPVGHFLVLFARSADNLLLRSFSPSLGNVSVSAPVELSLTFPRLLVLRLGLSSHSHKPGGLPSSAQFAFRRLGDPQHATILSSAAFCCPCLPSEPWC